MVNFLILLVLHFIADFYLQTSKMAKCKNANVGEGCDSCSSCRKNALFNNKYLVFHTLLYAVPFLLLFFMTKWTTATKTVAKKTTTAKTTTNTRIYCGSVFTYSYSFWSVQFV